MFSGNNFICFTKPYLKPTQVNLFRKLRRLS